MRHRLAVQSNTPTRSATGSESAVWTTQATVWGDIKPLDAGGEGDSAGVEYYEGLYLIRIRYSSDVSGINPTWRIVHDSRTFDIERVYDKHERNKEIRIHARLIDE